MKKILKLILTITIVSFIMDKIVYYSLNKISDQVYTGQMIGKLNQFIKIKNESDLLVFGSSRANHHINVAKLSDDSYNMGVNGRFITYHSALIKLLDKDLKQTIILHIDPSKAVDLNYDGTDIAALSTKFHRNKIIKQELSRIEKNKVLQHFYWCLDYNGKTIGILKNFLSSRGKQTENTGYSPLFVKQNDVGKEILKKVLKRENNGECPSEYSLNSFYRIHLKEIITFCKSNKRVIIVTSPQLIDHCKEDNVFVGEEFKKMGFEYYDFSDLFAGNDNLDLWKDKLHLSNVGAEIFTDSLQRILN